MNYTIESPKKKEELKTGDYVFIELSGLRQLVKIDGYYMFLDPQTGLVTTGKYETIKKLISMFNSGNDVFKVEQVNEAEFKFV